MIIIGYQGIGKTSLCKQYAPERPYVDLESSLMKDEFRNRWENWYEIYCNIAESLSSQGYVVFISSHKDIQDRLANSKEEVIAVYPSMDLKEDWVAKLYDRWNKDKTLKNEVAYLDARANYDKEIGILKRFKLYQNEIKSMSYRLEDVVEHWKKELYDAPQD